MKWSRYSLFVTLSIPLFIVAILVYDAIAVMNGGSEASISAILIKFSYEMPFMVFCTGFFIGLVSGHLFWRMKPNSMTLEIDEKK